MLIDEIQSKATPEMVSARDYSAIAESVNVGRTKVVSKVGGVGLVMHTLGSVAGAAVLDALEAQAATDSAVKWGLILIKQNQLDFGSDEARKMMDLLLTAEVATALKSVAVEADHVTPAQVANALDGGL